MIRHMHPKDIDAIMQLWLQGNLYAHPFVDSHYWQSHYDDVQKQILRAKVYVYEKEHCIVGFIGLIDDYIAGIFVDQNVQSQGVGQALLAHVQASHSALTLNVYAENTRACKFYLHRGFKIVNQQVDCQTNALDYTMQWYPANSTCIPK